MQQHENNYSGGVGNNNGNGDKLKKLADNSVAMIFTRYVMPIVLAITGWFMVHYLDGIISSINEVKAESQEKSRATWAAVQAASDKAQLAISSIDRTNQQLSDHVERENEINQSLQEITRDHEQRIRTIERHGQQ